MKKSILAVLLAVVVFYACQRQVSKPSTQSGGTVTVSSDMEQAINNAKGAPICFESDVLPIFQSSCAKSGCHDAKSHKEGLVLDSYRHIMQGEGIVPGQPFQSEIFQKIYSGEMPPKGNTPLTDAQMKIIGKWIKQGAQNTTNCAGCDTTQFTYSNTISVIFQTNCTGCHSGKNASGGIDLSTYAGAQVVALNGRLVGAVTHAPGYVPMPQGAPMLSDCNITEIEKWVAAGAPNN